MSSAIKQTSGTLRDGTQIIYHDSEKKWTQKRALANSTMSVMESETMKHPCCAYLLLPVTEVTSEEPKQLSREANFAELA